MEKSFSKDEKIISFDIALNYISVYEGHIASTPTRNDGLDSKVYGVYYEKMVVDNGNTYSLEKSDRMVNRSILYKSYEEIPEQYKKAAFKSMFGHDRIAVVRK